MAAEIEIQTAKISEWESRKDTNPHYARLIKNAGNECQKKKAEGDRRKAELDGIFKSHLLIELVGIARVLPGADANARTMSDRAGMRIVMGEGENAGQDGEGAEPGQRRVGPRLRL